MEIRIQTKYNIGDNVIAYSERAFKQFTIVGITVEQNVSLPDLTKVKYNCRWESDKREIGKYETFLERELFTKEDIKGMLEKLE